MATAAGPLVGGYLLAMASWRWVFFINVPVAAAVLVLTARHIPETSDPTAPTTSTCPVPGWPSSSWPASPTASSRARRAGWGHPAVVACLRRWPLAAPAFLLVERRSTDPMLPLSLFASRQFSGANAVTFVVYGALGGALFLLAGRAAGGGGLQPAELGARPAAGDGGHAAFSARSGQLSARIGPRLQMSVGPLVVGAGLALLARATTPGSYWVQVFPAVAALRRRPGRHRGAADLDRHGRRTRRALRAWPRP